MLEIELGCCPVDVEAVQLGDDQNGSKMLIQCDAWRRQLERALRNHEVYRGCQLRLRNKAFKHDFGTYYEVVASCEPDDELSIEAAFWLEANAPTNFDDDISPRYPSDDRDVFAESLRGAKIDWDRVPSPRKGDK